MRDTPHDLHGTVYVQSAQEAEKKARAAAADYFGSIEHRVSITTHEVRAVSGEVLHYEVDYYAAADPE